MLSVERVRDQEDKSRVGMYSLGYFLQAVATVADIVLLTYMWIVIVRAVLSWVNPDPLNPIVRFIHSITEPVLYRIRTTLPVSLGGIDFSPILVLLGIIFLRVFLVNSVARFAQTLI